MQATLLPFIQASQPSGTDVKAFCGRLNSNDTGFDGILQGILGSATKNNFPAAVSSSLTQTAIAQFQQNCQADQSGPQELGLLLGIVQKLATALAEQKNPVSTAELNELLKNILTGEELAFLQQFLQTNELSAAMITSGDSDFMPVAALSPESVSSAGQEQLKPLLSGLIVAVSDIINRQCPAAQTTSQNMFSQETTAQNALTQDKTPNPLQLLMALRDKLQQLYAACMKASSHPSSQANGNTALTAAAEQPLTQGQQTTLQNANLTSGQTAQTGQQQGDGIGQQGIATAQTGKQVLQNPAFLNDNGHSQKQQQNFSSLTDRMQAFAGKSGPGSGDMTLAQLFNQSQFGKALLASPQNPAGQGVDQLLGNAQLWQKLASVPQATVQIETVAAPQLLNQAQVNPAGTEKTLDQSALLSELLATGDTQHAFTRFEQAAAADRVFAKAPVNSSYIIDQILSRISAAAKQGEHKLTLQLYPPSLGKLHIELAMKDNQLRAVVIAESSQVKQMLDANIDQLRTSLESQNIQIDKLSVMVAGEGGGDFERSASYLRDRSGRGKKHTGFDNALGQAGATIADPAALLWNRQGIINADAVDVFA